MVAEAIKALMFPDRAYTQTFTVGNIFLGFESAGSFDRAAASVCECVTHRPLIGRLRAGRLGRAQHPIQNATS